MKEEYFNELKELFANSNFDENVYEQILDKYNTWYDKLLGEGKNDEEIQSLLKSPSDVFDIFNEKYKTVIQDADTSVVEEPSFVDNTQNINDENIKNATTKDTVGDSNTSDNSNLDPNLIVTTMPNGKTKYFKKRTFMGGLGMFFVLALVSVFVFPVLLSIFSMFLSASVLSLMLLFMPVHYLMYINQYGVISYLTPENLQSFQASHDIAGYTLPAGSLDYLNNLISQLNQLSTFDFGVFLHTIIIALFAFAFLLLSIYLTIQSFKLMVNYFSMLFNTITLKKVKL